MLAPQDIGELERERQEMKELRNQLFILFLRNPAKVQLATEIRKLDDKVAEYTETLRLNR